MPTPFTRRDALYGLGATLGSVAFSAMLADEARAAAGRLSPKSPQVSPRATSCIFLMMDGGPSHIDTFDPKPKLNELHLKEFARNDQMQSAMSSGKRYYVASPFPFRKAGASGVDMAVNWEHLAGVADELCFYRGCQVDSVNHPTALYQMNTGNRFGGDPALGAWTTYGLGSENQNLPGFVVLPDVSLPQGGAANWGNGFLPAHFQGTTFRAKGSPILDLSPHPAITREHQRANLDLLGVLNRRHAAERPENSALAARMESYELAFRMQAEVPELLDLGQESAQTQTLYGIGEEPTDAFGRRCLLARRLVQQGVRFVQLYAGTWDSHDAIERAHGNLVKQVDKPIAGLIADLKRTGMLDSTLVVWCGEFGRSPDNGVRMGTAFGRDHNPKAMTILLAGGGVKAGHIVGATDEIGAEAVDCVHHVRDLHVTLLHLLGLDDNKLTYFHGGRFKQLSQFGGAVIKDLLA
ncbi:MAG TPA: DUF1501 domain-containing protein [Caulifigura sp.]|nr:DUF1501 domain-containing protein [Caulifigura sp.]